MNREIKFRLWHKEEKFMLNIWPYEWLKGHWAGTIDKPSEYFNNEFDITPDGKNCNRIKGKSVFMTIDGKIIGVLPFDEKTTQSVNYSDQYEIMQFTGLQDKNGKDIYEGDIINIKDIEFERFDVSCGEMEEVFKDAVVSVFYEETSFCYTHPNADCAVPLAASDVMEVIGNIYENPELLAQQ